VKRAVPHPMLVLFEIEAPKGETLEPKSPKDGDAPVIPREAGGK
jgi:hypothetical protein